MEKVSIIIPVYGVEKYIRKCLDSLINQTLENIEIIIVNDGSKDNSQQIIDEYVKKYPNKVKSFIKENGGQGSARNYGLKHATGKYIGYVDSDDYVETNMFEKLYFKAKQDNLDIVICTYNNIYENSSKSNKTEPLILKTNDDVVNALFSSVSICTKLYKKEILEELEFKCNVWYEDFAFNCKAIMKSKKIGFINESLYNYLIRFGSTMNNSNIKRNLEILDAFDDILEYIHKNKKYEKFFSEIEYLAIYHIYIAAITRVINIKAKGKKEIVRQLKEYVIVKFPFYKENKYLNLLDRNKKIVYNLIRSNQYWLIKIIFFLKGR